MKKMDLIWHEAGNPLYFDRFTALAEYFDLRVFGFKKFRQYKFTHQKKSKKLNITLLKPTFSNHWLTVFSFRLIKELMKSESEIIYIHEEPHSLLSFLVCVFCRDKKIYIDAAVINRKLSFWRLNPLEAIVYKKVTGVFYRNEEVKEVLMQRGCPSEKIKCQLGNGVSAKTFSKKIPRRLQEDKGNIVVGYAGRVWHWKGIDCLIEIQNMHGYEVRYCGPIVDAKLQQRLLMCGAKYLGELDKQGLIDFYSGIDLFVLPSLPSPNWKEQFGRVVVEAIFCGSPAIGSDTGFIPNLVGASSVFKAGDIDSIKEVLFKFHTEESRKKLHQWQYNMVSQQYSWEAIAKLVSDHV